MRTFALPWLLAAPPAPTSVAVVWSEEATVPELDQQRVVEEVRTRLGLAEDAVIADAVALARLRMAQELEPSRLQMLVVAQERLEEAQAAFRAGELEAALEGARSTLALLHHDPGLPSAATLAYAAHLLRARLAWTRGELEAADAAMRAALALDPQARLSTRTAPPDVAARYAQLQAELLAGAERWPRLTLPPDVELEVEADGRLGVLALPPGEHFVVVRRLGARPRAVVVHTDDLPQPLPVPEERVPAGWPTTRRVAAELCARLRVDRLLLVDERGERFGAQSYGCEQGFGSPWIGEDDRWAEGISVALQGGPAGRFDRPYSTFDQPWPMAEEIVAVREPVPVEGRVDLEPRAAQRPWYRRAWVWVLVGSVVAAGVTTGAVLGTRASQTRSWVEIPDDFIEPEGRP